MRWTQYFINTLREVPADADVISQKLMMRAGMIRKVATGIYTYLPLGLRSIQKMEAIVREEMNRAGAIELLMPAIQPAELWQESGRWFQYGKELLRIKDRHDREFVFGPTHEEVITDTVRDSISSYRQLPVNLYQIQMKFRDEVRPRFGLMRGREFIMKDAYSFHTSAESLGITYDAMRDAYNRIFKRCALDHVMVEADTGNIGGSESNEFMVVAQSGEDAIVRCGSCGYGANIEKAVSHYHLPLPAQGEALAMEEVETPGTQSIADVAKFLKLEESELVKTLVYKTENGAVMVLLRGDREANEIKVKNALGVQQLELLPDHEFEAAVGGPIGYCGPVGSKVPKVYADSSLQGRSNWIVGANKKNFHLRNVNVDRDFKVESWADVTSVKVGDPCARCGGSLEMYRGIEVGHIFKLGTKYSSAMNCVYLDEKGERQPMIMGCYGLGVGRTVAAAIEQNNDADGIVWPLPIAPFQAVITQIGMDEQVRAQAGEIYEKLIAAGVEALWDDRDERPGVKFKDADLIGFPLRIGVGAKSLANGQVEFSTRRAAREKQLISPAEAIERVIDAVRNSRG